MVRRMGGPRALPVPLRHIRDIRNANWSPQNAQQNWLRRLEIDLIGPHSSAGMQIQIQR